MGNDIITLTPATKTINVLAYITAFEDISAVKRCLQSLADQSFPVAKILIVDNSPNRPILPTDYQDVCAEITEKIIIQYHPENIGVGGGLEIAFNFGKQEKYDFIWTFDQDSIPSPDCLQILIEKYHHISQTNFPIGIIAPTAIDKRTNSIIEAATFQKYRFLGQHHQDVDFYECDAPITSGSLIPLSVIQSISPQLTNLFIDGVDFELGMQIKQQGFHNIIITSAKMYHLFGIPTQVSFLGQEKTIHLYSPLRHYYICRNHTFLELKYVNQSVNKWLVIAVYLWRIKLTLSMIVKIYLYHPEDRYSKIQACFLGTYHGLIGKLGKNWC